MTTPAPPQSPPAQAVWDAAWTNCPVQCGDIEGTRRSQIAAALIAAAGTVPKEAFGCENYATGFTHGIRFSCQFLHDLAAELEQAAHNTTEAQ